MNAGQCHHIRSGNIDGPSRLMTHPPIKPRCYIELCGIHSACRYVQVEYGPMELDLNLRVPIHELEKHLADQVALPLHPSCFYTTPCPTLRHIQLVMGMTSVSSRQSLRKTPKQI